MECYNYSCPIRETQLPTSDTRCECIACLNRSAKHTYIVSNRSLSEADIKEIDTKNYRRNKEYKYEAGPWMP